MKKMKKKMSAKEYTSKQMGKLNAIKELHDVASSMMGDDMKMNKDKIKKITVASNSKKGLRMGLDKAEELLKKKKV